MVFEIENYLALRKAMDEFCNFLLAEQVEKERVFDSKLAVYELIGNVLKHSEHPSTALAGRQILAGCLPY